MRLFYMDLELRIALLCVLSFSLGILLMVLYTLIYVQIKYGFWIS